MSAVAPLLYRNSFMCPPDNSSDLADVYHLDRFVQAQEATYDRALRELRGGRKQTHWMWFIFPQLVGLALSATSLLYAIQSLDEARAYLAHPVLGARLVECAEAVMAVSGRSALEIFGEPDDRKMRSCATLFALVSPENSVFGRLIDRYYAGERDPHTLELLGLTE